MPDTTDHPAPNGTAAALRHFSSHRGSADGREKGWAYSASLAATLCYNNAIDRVGPVHASLFIHLVPLFGSLLAIAFLGERPGWQHLLGMALILSGILQARRAALAVPTR